MSEFNNASSTRRSKEYAAVTMSGYLAAVLIGVLFVAALFWLLISITQDDPGFSIALSILALLFAGLCAKGFYMLQPNQAAAITLFGSYRGTDRSEGLRWVWPWQHATKISVRANNLISQQIKVNDLRGNPIEIAAQVVWRVSDTAQALFDVDDYNHFVSAQVEAAVRSIGARYPYDDIEHKEVTLRGNHDEIASQLQIALTDRLNAAGISVDECGLTHLAYAQEIAGAMLRRQQAEAVVAARTTLVTGAVGMVELALELLAEKSVVKLDDERKAAMVSNLMVVLCSERDTQPVVNAGTLYS
jgi:regulator of protease activity HflC (stomatin/prohibitin superfamily)